MNETYDLRPIGRVSSSIRSRDEAPMQADQGAPEAWLEIDPAYAEAARGLEPGQHLVLVTWLHLADRSTLRVHPGSNPNKPLTGVFATRSPDRPNPIGLHRVTLLEVAPGPRLRVDALEVVDGTPVLDLKPVLDRHCER